MKSLYDKYAKALVLRFKERDDNVKCNNEVFKEINSRKQDPEQAIVWAGIGANGKWQKMKDQLKETLYVANYSKCKL